VALNGLRLVSERFPYLPLRLELRGRLTSGEALLDTGFEAHIVISESQQPAGQEPDGHVSLGLADGSRRRAPWYFGTASLDGIGTFVVPIVALGDETLLGQSLIARMSVLLDHGGRVVVEP
jgi:predicted aspartyl protease